VSKAIKAWLIRCFTKDDFSIASRIFGASLFDITETLSKLMSGLRCVQYKRGAFALLQQRLERTQKRAQN